MLQKEAEEMCCEITNTNLSFKKLKFSFDNFSPFAESSRKISKEEFKTFLTCQNNS